MKQAILIVDDEFGLAEMVCEVLTEQGYDVALAINGERALGLMAERRFDLVLLDVMMPIMDGPTCLAHMRDDTKLRTIPVVMMSAFETARPTNDAMYQGFLLKPFSLAELLTEIRPLLANAKVVALR